MSDEQMTLTVYLFRKDGVQLPGLAIVADANAAMRKGRELGAKVYAVQFAATHVESAWDFETRTTFKDGDEVRVKDEYLHEGLLAREVVGGSAFRRGTRGLVIGNEYPDEKVVVEWTDEDPSVQGWRVAVPARCLEHMR